MRHTRLVRWVVGVCLPLAACAEPSLQATPPAAAERGRGPATESARTTNTTATTHATTHPEPASPADATPSPASARTELLVGGASDGCSAKQCPGQCCNTCGRVVWKLASDPKARVVTRGVALPDLVATECPLHYDLRAEGEKQGDSFVVRAAQPVPSKRGRRRGTHGQLELRAEGGSCTLMACENPCCNMCSGVHWVPKPTLDAITWSGSVLLPSSAMDCEGFPDRVVTGTWLGPSAFEITSARTLRKRPRE